MISARERKQKIEVDPRNTTWSEDAGGFGFRMLERMGWSKGKGLGKHEDGTVQHLKQKMKQDLSGIGANDKDTSQNWLAHTDAYASLLSNLKTIGPSTETATSSSSSESESSDEEERPTGGLGSSSDKAKREKEADEIMTNNPRYGRLYHRAKFQKGKNARDYDTASLNAILGIPNTVPAPLAGGKKVTETTFVLDNGWVKSKTVINERTAETETTEVIEKVTTPDDAPRKRKRDEEGDTKKEKKKKKKAAAVVEQVPEKESLVSPEANAETEKSSAAQEPEKKLKKKKKVKNDSEAKPEKKKKEKRKDGAEEKTEKKKRKKASSS